MGRSATSIPDRTCARCGRRFAWRRKWARTWDRVLYCSAACHRTRPDETDAALERALFALLGERARGATICPSEVARRVGGDDWRALMERTRRAARRGVADGRLEITQAGRVVDPATARGPIRLRRARSASS